MKAAKDCTNVWLFRAMSIFEESTGFSPALCTDGSGPFGVFSYRKLYSFLLKKIPLANWWSGDFQADGC
jgi:hypothetical protein